jgi:hypothetical protein
MPWLNSVSRRQSSVTIVLVRKRGLEPLRPCGRQPLKLVTLLC